MPVSSVLPMTVTPRRWNVWGLRALGFVLSIAIAAYLLLQIDGQQFLATIQGLSVSLLLGVFVIYMLLNFFRATRFSVLLGGVPTLPLYPIALYHNFLVRTLPFKTGELSYVVMTRHYLHKSLVEGVGSLVSARLFDLLVVASGCTVGLLTVVAPSADHTLFVLFVPCLVVCAVLLYFAAPVLRKGLALEAILLENRPLGKSQAVAWGRQRIQVLIDHLQRIHTPRLFVILLGLSVCNYVCSASFNMLLIHGLGIQMPFGTLIVVVSIAMFAEALPFSVAGLGLVEGGWTLGLVQFAGLPVSQAISIAFFLHACQLAAVVLSGLIGYCFLHSPAFQRRAA